MTHTIQPRFSVVVPIYKVERYLDECVASVLAQEGPSFELLLVDDGSPDACPQKCGTWATQDSRVQVLHQKNQGLSVARNTGLKAAQGEYILFLDGDDFLTENALSELNSRLSQLREPDIFMGKMRLFVDGETPCAAENWEYPTDLPLYEPALAYARALRETGEMLWSACRAVYRRTMLQQNALYFRQGILTEDLEWFPRVVLQAKSFAMEDVPFYNYRIKRMGSIVTQTSSRLLADTFMVMKGWQNSTALPLTLKSALMGKILDLYFIMLGKLGQMKKPSPALWQEAQALKVLTQWAGTPKQKSASVLLSLIGIRGFARVQQMRRRLLHK